MQLQGTDVIHQDRSEEVSLTLKLEVTQGGDEKPPHALAGVKNSAGIKAPGQSPVSLAESTLGVWTSRG